MDSDEVGVWLVMCEIVGGRRSCDRLAPHRGLWSMPGSPFKAIVVGRKFLSCVEGEEGYASGLNRSSPLR